MAGILVGYCRTSSAEQQAGLEAQERDLKGAGVEKLFSEQVSSVAKRDRLEAAIDFCREGDTLSTHTRDLLKTMPIDKVALIPVWHEVQHLFPAQYLAALAWAEEVTNLSETNASDHAYAAEAAAFEPKALVDLPIAIAAMNAFNRLGAPFRLPVKARP